MLLLLSMVEARKLANYYDAEGRPVCPTCGQAILLTDPVMRVDDCMVHVRCAHEARMQPDPCAPQEPAPRG